MFEKKDIVRLCVLIVILASLQSVFIVTSTYMRAETMNGEVFMQDFWSSPFGQLIINFIAALIFNAAFTIIAYFAFLRKIPEKTYEKINQLLNERLNYETTNHNAVMSALNPNTSYLSQEHQKLETLSAQVLDHLHTEKARQDERNRILTDDQREIKDKLHRALSGLETKLEESQRENSRLKYKLQTARQYIELLKEQPLAQPDLDIIQHFEDELQCEETMSLSP